MVIAFAAWLFSLPLSIASGSVGAVLGASFAIIVIQRAHSRGDLDLAIRLPAILGAASVIALTGLSIAIYLRNGSSLNQGVSALAGESLQPLTLYKSGEFIAALLLAAAVCGTLRLLALRSAAGRMAEIIFTASSIVLTLTAHRNGMIDRPFILGDFALIRGYDPAYLLMSIGVAALLALVAINLRDTSGSRNFYHLSVISIASLMLFVFVERIGLPSPELTNDLGLTGNTGQSEHDDNPFQDSTNDPKDKAAPVAVVVFHDDYEPVDGSYYFRESAYSQFNGTRIDYASRADMDTDLLAGFRDPSAANIGHALSPIPAAPRKTVRTTIGTLIPHRAPFALDTPTGFTRVANPNTTRFDTTYEATSAVPLFDYNTLIGRETGAEDWSEDLRAEYLRLPDDPRYSDLAHSLTASLKPEFSNDAFAQVWVIKQYLDENGIYSLKNAHATEQDPAASFLFGDLTGYCVHFAFSAVYLYRSLGIPARVGVGYSVPASNRAGGSSLLIQAIHGHAWPEVYFRDVGWVIIDPAPQQTLVDMATDPQDNLQQLLGDMLRDDASFDQFIAAQAEQRFDFGLLAKRLFASLFIAAFIVLCLSYLTKAYTRLAPRFGRSEWLYRSTLKANLERLASMGFNRQYGESREAFAERCQELSPSFYALTRAHLQRSLADKRQPCSTDWLALDHSIQQELRTNLPLWRRIAGLLNPLSSLAAR